MRELILLMVIALVGIQEGSAQYPFTGEYLTYEEFEQFIQDTIHQFPKGSVIPVVPREALPPPPQGMPTGHINEIPYEQYLVYVYPGVTQVPTYTGQYDLCSFCHINGYHLPGEQLQLTEYGLKFANQPEHATDPIAALKTIEKPPNVQTTSTNCQWDWSSSPLDVKCVEQQIQPTIQPNQPLIKPLQQEPSNEINESGNVDLTPAPVTDNINAQAISSCIDISLPGEYTLNTNITNSSASTCIYINSSNVILDGANHTIDGIGENYTAGVYINNPAMALTNVTVKNLKLSNWHFGIIYDTTINGSISHNTVISTGLGIGLVSSSNNTLNDNLAGLNGFGVILAASSNNILINNVAGLNYLGIALIDSNGSNLTGNWIFGNYYGVALSNSSSNAIYNNYFNSIINNSIFADMNSSNYWNANKTQSTNIVGGPYLGGNYWADPNGTGFSETCSDTDGICDLPYKFNNSNTDHMPLALVNATTPVSGAQDEQSIAQPQAEIQDLGDFRVMYVPVSNPYYMEYQQELVESKKFDMIADGLNNVLALPSDIDIILTECGTINALYDPKNSRILMCYELIGYSEQLLAPYVPDAENLRATTFNATYFVFFHEMGHALIDKLNLPITGKEEDAADQLATLILVESGEEGEMIALTGAAGFIGSSLQQPEAQNLPYWDVHSLDMQRYYNLACWIYGKDPQNHSYIIQQGLLPEERAMGCELEYQKLLGSWNTLLSPYIKEV